MTTPASDKLAQVMSMVNQSSAIIYTLGIFDDYDDDRNPHALKEFSRASGGEAFFPKTLAANSPICERSLMTFVANTRSCLSPRTRRKMGLPGDRSEGAREFRRSTADRPHPGRLYRALESAIGREGPRRPAMRIRIAQNRGRTCILRRGIFQESEYARAARTGEYCAGAATPSW